MSTHLTQNVFTSRDGLDASFTTRNVINVSKPPLRVYPPWPHIFHVFSLHSVEYIQVLRVEFIQAFYGPRPGATM